MFPKCFYILQNPLAAIRNADYVGVIKSLASLSATVSSEKYVCITYKL